MGLWGKVSKWPGVDCFWDIGDGARLTVASQLQCHKLYTLLSCQLNSTTDMVGYFDSGVPCSMYDALWPLNGGPILHFHAHANCPAGRPDCFYTLPLRCTWAAEPRVKSPSESGKAESLSCRWERQGDHLLAFQGTPHFFFKPFRRIPHLSFTHSSS